MGWDKNKWLRGQAEKVTKEEEGTKRAHKMRVKAVGGEGWKRADSWEMGNNPERIPLQDLQ